MNFAPTTQPDSVTPVNNTLKLDTLLAGEWQQCQALFNHAYPSQGKTAGAAIGQPLLLSIIHSPQLGAEQSLVSFIHDQLEAAEKIDAAIEAALGFAEQLLSDYCANSPLHEDINKLLLLFRVSVAGSLISRQLPWQGDSHSAATMLLVQQQAVGWQPLSGRAAAAYIERLKTHIKAIVYAADSDVAKVGVTALQGFFDGENKRTSKLEKRLVDAEIGSLMAKHARQLSARTLNQHMAGKKIPAAISAFLQGPWRESMHLVIIQQGKDSEPWQRMIRLTQSLIASLQPAGETDTQNRQQLYGSIAELSEELREVTIGLHHSNTLDSELAAIEAEHIKLLKNQPLDYASFPLIDNTDAAISDQASVSGKLLAQVSRCQEGQWFMLQREAQPNRIKLTAKIPLAQQLLFSNFLGMKAAHYSFEEFAYLLSSKTIVPLHTEDYFSSTGEQLLRQLHASHQQQQSQATQQKAQHDEQLRQQHQARQQAMEQQLQEARDFAKSQQQLRLAAEQLRSEQQQQQELAQHQENINQQLQTLQIGARVLFQPQGEAQLCKLAAILQSTGLYIFVDRQGIKQHSLSREQLAQQLQKQSATIIDQGSNFETTLEKVVDNLRTRK